MKNKEIIKQLESLLEKLKKEETKPEIDFSILNDIDIFYISYIGGNDYLFVGENPYQDDVITYCISSQEKYNTKFCNKHHVKELRKATQEEIALYRQHYPVKQKVWIEVYKVNSSLGVRIHYSTKSLNTSLKETNNKDFITTLEIIEREY